MNKTEHFATGVMVCIKYRTDGTIEVYAYAGRLGRYKFSVSRDAAMQEERYAETVRQEREYEEYCHRVNSPSLRMAA